MVDKKVKRERNRTYSIITTVYRALVSIQVLGNDTSSMSGRRMEDLPALSGEVVSRSADAKRT